MGSIIADTGLIFGVGCLVTTLPADRFVLQRQGWVQFGSGLLLAAICYTVWWLQPEATIGRSIGLLFLALLAGYLLISIRWSQEHRAGEPFQVDDEEAIEKKSRESLVELSTRMAVGLVLVLVFSHVLIICVELLAERWGIPRVVIASTIVALGTSLSELVVGLTAIYKGHTEILVGNVIGADILNVLFVVGASAAAAELPLTDPDAKIPALFLFVHVPTMILILALFRAFIFRAVRTGRFSRWMGAPLLCVYLVFIAVTLMITRS